MPPTYRAHHGLHGRASPCIPLSRPIRVRYNKSSGLRFSPRFSDVVACVHASPSSLPGFLNLPRLDARSYPPDRPESNHVGRGSDCSGPEVGEEEATLANPLADAIFSRKRISSARHHGQASDWLTTQLPVRSAAAAGARRGMRRARAAGAPYLGAQSRAARSGSHSRQAGAGAGRGRHRQDPNSPPGSSTSSVSRRPRPAVKEIGDLHQRKAAGDEAAGRPDGRRGGQHLPSVGRRSTAPCRVVKPFDATSTTRSGCSTGPTRGQLACWRPGHRRRKTARPLYGVGPACAIVSPPPG